MMGVHVFHVFHVSLHVSLFSCLLRKLATQSMHRTGLLVVNDAYRHRLLLALCAPRASPMRTAASIARKDS
jgi:hypothetical protein